MADVRDTLIADSAAEGGGGMEQGADSATGPAQRGPRTGLGKTATRALVGVMGALLLLGLALLQHRGRPTPASLPLRPGMFSTLSSHDKDGANDDDPKDDDSKDGDSSGKSDTTKATTTEVTTTKATTPTTTKISCLKAGCVPGCDVYDVLCAYEDKPLEDMKKEVFPGVIGWQVAVHDPIFVGYNDYWNDCNCRDGWQYFNEVREHVEPLFTDKLPRARMNHEYQGTTLWRRPLNDHRQTVLGLAEMLQDYWRCMWPGCYPNKHWPYMVMAMEHWTQANNWRFVECGLLGWPGSDELQPSDPYPLRIVLKAKKGGHPCYGASSGGPFCSLESSWTRIHARYGNKMTWRATAKEVNGLFHLCAQKYHCKCIKSKMPRWKEMLVPQVYLCRVMWKHGHPVRRH